MKALTPPPVVTMQTSTCECKNTGWKGDGSYRCLDCGCGVPIPISDAWGDPTGRMKPSEHPKHPDFKSPW